METKSMTLEEAWASREKLWRQGTILIADGNKMWKEITALPGSTRVDVWLGISEASCEAANKVSRGYATRLEADQIWRDAIVEEKGDKCRLTWEFEDLKKAYRCILSTGEVFEP